MSQIFHHSTNTVSKVSIFGALFLIGAALWLTLQFSRSPYATGEGVVRSQPVPFSHQHHVGGIGIDCRYCHNAVEVSASAGMPSTKTCMNCHSQIWNQSAMLEPVRESFRTDRSIEWNRVHDLPDFAYFPHASHVNRGIGCSTCHGRVDRMPLMAQAASLQMEWCLECHRDPAKFVRPQDQVFNAAWEPGPDHDGGRLVREYDLKPSSSCSTCHR
jgi:hypothetical protein